MDWPDPGSPAPVVGQAMHDLIDELYPIPRSLTGDGVRKTLAILSELVPLQIREVPSGAPVLDWTVPDEWNVREAWIRRPDGERIADFQRSSLHLVGYSVPFRGTLPLGELRPRLHTLPEHPDRIPYRTSYYERDWGFCLRHSTLEALREGEYEVCVDTTLEPGSLTYGEVVIEGSTEEEVLLSCHVCHPALANDNLSGVSLAVAAARDILARTHRRYTYRFLFIPGTVGSIAWLAGNEDVATRIRHGLVLSGVGYDSGVTYKRSRRGDAEIDRAAEYVLAQPETEADIRDFTPYGYDERQYCSPGYDLPVGCFMRKPWGEYDEYHTSADDPGLVRPEYLADSLDKVRGIVEVLEGNRTFRNLSPKGEPQLGRRGLYRAKGGDGLPGYELALLWILNMSDGRASLLDIARRSGLSFPVITQAADDLADAGLLEAAEA